jgi:hypothetical protein
LGEAPEISRNARIEKPQVPPLRCATVGGCDFFDFPHGLWPESLEEHLPTSIVIRLRAQKTRKNENS